MRSGCPLTHKPRSVDPTLWGREGCFHVDLVYPQGTGTQGE